MGRLSKSRENIAAVKNLSFLFLRWQKTKWLTIKDFHCWSVHNIWSCTSCLLAMGVNRIFFWGGGGTTKFGVSRGIATRQVYNLLQ